MARTQLGRPFRLKSTLGDDALLIESFTGEERLSTPFRFVLRALAEDPNIDMKGLLRKPLVLTIVLEDTSERHIHGNISSMKLLGAGTDGLAAYQIEMVPWFWFTQLFSDCRIFQGKTVQQIIEQIFGDRGFHDFKFSLQGSYTAREYCVQYNETDFNFISRLCEEEGIFYYFEQTQAKHSMVFVDKNASLTACAKMAEARYTPATGGHLDEDTVTSIEHQFQVHIGTVQRRDYDFVKPATDLFATLDGQDPGVDYGYPGNYEVKGDGDVRTRVRLEEYESRVQTVFGNSNCRGFECGYKFTLAEHFRTSADQEYVLTAISHQARNTSYRSGDATPYEYSNNFEALPSATPFRPPVIARKPVIRGTQTAVVVGKAGEEIWTDKYGRVTVQFHWDREGKADEKSSIFIRVSQLWAGKKWGAMYIPRIGQEVIVSFLEGDPDRPIIVGRVYNEDQAVPYDLPAEQTKSTIKSMSSKGGGGFNEFRFEDKKGSEQIFMHAEKDLDIRVKNIRKEWIGASRSLIVGGDKFEKVSGDEHNHTVGKKVDKIDGNHFLNVLGAQGIEVVGNQSLTVNGTCVNTIDGNHEIWGGADILISGKKVVVEAETGLTLSVGGNFITIDMSGVTVKGTLIKLNSGGAALSAAEPSAVAIEAPKDPADADNAQPGGTTSAPAAHTTGTLNTSLDNVSPAAATPADEDVPDRVAPASAPASGRSATPEYSTFPKDVDAEAVAKVLTDAAQTGVPFCEECEKAKKQQQQDQQTQDQDTQ